MSWLITCVGAAAGAAHACVLASAVRHGPSVLTALVRLALSLGLLLGASVLGVLLTGALAWAFGFAWGAVMLLRRWR